MKKWMAILFAGVTLADAQAGGLGFSGAYWNPKDAEDGYGAAARLQVDLSSTVSLDIRGAYFPDMSEDISTPAGEIDSDLEIIPLEVGLLLHPKVADKGVQPYIGGGIGYYMLELDTESPSGLDNRIDLDDEVGWYAVAGLKLRFSQGLALVLEAQYRGVEGTAKGDDIGDIDDAYTIDLEGFGANAGLMLSW